MSRFTKGLFAVAGMSLCVSGTALANDLTVVSWGGAYTKSQVEAYHKPWMAKTGKTIISEDYGGGIAEIKAQVESGNVTWDVVDVELADALRACDEGLLETIDHSCCHHRQMEFQQPKTSLMVHCKSAPLPTLFGHLFTPMTQASCVTGMRLKLWLISLTQKLTQVSVA